MISVSFINDSYEPLLASDPFLPLEKLMTEMTEEIDFAVDSYLNMHGQYMIESEIMGELDDEKSIYLESEKENVFDKIGKAVIALFKKFSDVVSKIIDWVSDLVIKNKSDEEKVDAVLKRYKKEDPKSYPDVKQALYKALNAGPDTLDLSDARTLKEIREMTDSVLKAAKQREIDSNTLRGKFEALKQKVDDIDKGKTNKTATVVKNVAGAVVTVATLRGVIVKSKKDITDWKKHSADRNAEVASCIDKLRTMDDGKYSPDNMKKAKIMYNVETLMYNLDRKLITAEQGKLKAITQGISAWLARYEKNKTDSLLSSAERINSMSKDKREKERERAREDAEDKAIGQKQGEQKHYEKNKQSIHDRITDETQVKTRANDKLVRSGERDDVITKTARLQAVGKAQVPSKKKDSNNNDDDED